MAEKNYILGVDVGNTVIKAVLFDTEGYQIAHCAIDGQSSFPEPGHVERDLSELWENGCAAIREVIARSGVDPARIGFDDLLRVFWENHDPTQGMRQGNDTGTQYRSAIYADTPEQYAAAAASREAFQQRLNGAGFGPITTEIVHPAPTFYYAEDYHQQYLAKNPNGYCGLGGTGVSCPIGLDATAASAD